eukprot:3127349-Rhodomonas_salina.1
MYYTPQHPWTMFAPTKPTRDASVSSLVLQVLSTILMSVGMLWTLTIIVTRIHVFHNAYIHQLQAVEDERWLRFQCEDSTFFANLGQHVSLCQQVQENAKRNVILVALNETMSTSSLCGAVHCHEILTYILNS